LPRHTERAPGRVESLNCRASYQRDLTGDNRRPDIRRVEPVVLVKPSAGRYGRGCLPVLARQIRRSFAVVAVGVAFVELSLRARRRC
jgi:hypothetical protein